VSDLVKLRGDWHPEVLANGRTIAPGEPFDRSDLQDADQRFLDEGLLIEATLSPVTLEGEDLQERAKALGIRGRGKMSARELREAVALEEARSGETTQPVETAQVIGEGH
jgi:hypothetical protein